MNPLDNRIKLTVEHDDKVYTFDLPFDLSADQVVGEFRKVMYCLTFLPDNIREYMPTMEDIDDMIEDALREDDMITERDVLIDAAIDASGDLIESTS
jgi:hypothetical protein